METTTLPFQTQHQKASRTEIVNFYEEATADYKFWSADMNMHFGYFKLGCTNPLRRDSMLNEMNSQVFTRLSISSPTSLDASQTKQEKITIADLGCGMGGAMRHFLKMNPLLNIFGITLSPFQVREGNKLLDGTNAVILQENYCNTSIESDSMDGVVAMESFCHSGHSREPLRESFRILKKGGKLVIADAFVRKQPSELSPISRLGYNQLCKGWSLDGLGVISEVQQRLENCGFKNVKIEDVSMHVAPSVFHVPFTITGFIIKELFQQKTIKKQSWNNMKASFYSLLSGLHLQDFGYHIITATK